MKSFISALSCVAAATAAHGQSNVTVYGLVDAAVTTSWSGSGTTTPGGSIATGPSHRDYRLDSGIGPGSRLGFRGREDLGGGLAADFVLEMGLAVDTGALTVGGLAFGRQAFVGLSGANWTISAGRQYSPLDVAFILSDPLGSTYWANTVFSSGHGTYSTAGSAPGSGAFNTTVRVDNSILGTITLGPVTAKLMVSAGNEAADGTGRLINPDLRYAAGPVTFQASYLRLRTPTGFLATGAAPEWMTEWLAGGSYDFTAFKLFAGAYGFQVPKDRSKLSAAALASFAWERTRTAWIGAQVPIGLGRVGVALSRQTYDYAAEVKGRSTSAGAFYEHPLSKRTTLYTSYGQVSSDAFARTTLYAAGSTVALNGYGADPKALSIGMRHTF